jgi:hypothetical protein
VKGYITGEFYIIQIPPDHTLIVGFNQSEGLKSVIGGVLSSIEEFYFDSA